MVSPGPATQAGHPKHHINIIFGGLLSVSPGDALRLPHEWQPAIVSWLGDCTRGVGLPPPGGKKFRGPTTQGGRCHRQQQLGSCCEAGHRAASEQEQESLSPVTGESMWREIYVEGTCR